MVTHQICINMTGSYKALNPQPRGVKALGSVGVEIQNGEQGFKCPDANCVRVFKSTQGLNSHMGKAHKKIVILRSEPPRLEFTKWSDEEFAVLAAIDLADHGPKYNRARRIYNEFRDRGFERTYGSVETQLRSQKYRDKRDLLRVQNHGNPPITEGLSRVVPERASRREAVVRLDVPDSDEEMSDQRGSLQTPGDLDPGTPDQVSPLRRAGPSTTISDHGPECETDRKQDFINIMKTCFTKPGIECFPGEEKLRELVSLYESGGEFCAGLNSFVESLATTRTQKVKNSQKGPELPNQKLRKKFAYKMLQKRWHLDRSKVARKILSGIPVETTRPENIDGFIEHWSKTYVEEPNQCNVDQMKSLRPGYQVEHPVFDWEIKQAFKGMTVRKAPGPDNVSVMELKSWPVSKLQLVLNLILASGKPPECAKRSNTIFIPKKDEPVAPNDFRPISLSPVLLRIVNKILARRILAHTGFDYRQKAFLPCDGIAENVVVLEAVINDAHKRNKPLYLATLDMKNAYGSVYHEAIFKALECNGASDWLVNYVRQIYEGFSTNLMVGNNPEVIQVNRGVLQGDPLSPVLFNMVIDQVLSRIPSEIGYSLKRERLINGQAFADDMNLLATSSGGLQCSLNVVDEVAKPWGLEFNPSKCSVMALRYVKRHGMVLWKDDHLYIGGSRIPSITEGKPWKYLGVYFSHRGIVDVPVTLDDWLARVKKCEYLKPQQKLYVLRVHVLPKLIHRLSFGNLSGKRLEKMDRKVRNWLKGFYGILHLPKSTPTAFFYARIKDGGLGLMRLRHSIPAMTFRRFNRFQNCHADVKLASEMSANKRRLHKCAKLIARFGDVEGYSTDEIAGINRDALYALNDGSGLRWSQPASFVHGWVGQGSTAFFGGGEFVNAIKLRINALPSKSRHNRDLPLASRLCRAGCREPETQWHCIQKCFRTHLARCKRHNEVARVLSEALAKLGYTVTQEALYRTEEGLRKPDIIAVKGDNVYVIDPTVVSDGYSPDVANDFKCLKYQGFPEIGEELGRKHPGCKIHYGSLSCTYRGMMSGKSVDFLEAMGVKSSTLQLCTMTAIRGSIRCFGMFHLSNSTI